MNLLKMLLLLIVLVALPIKGGEMSETKHTPLPWVASPNGAAFNLSVESGGEHFMILLGMTHQRPGEHEANVRLIIQALDFYSNREEEK